MFIRKYSSRMRKHNNKYSHIEFIIKNSDLKKIALSFKFGD